MKVIGVLLILATIAAGIYVDLKFFLIGGINQIINGFSAHPDNVHDIVWGFVRVLILDGAAFAVAAILSFFWAVIFFGYETKRSRRRQRAAFFNHNNTNLFR